MRILVTGAGGQRGYDIMKELSRRGHEVIGTEVSVQEDSLVRMDITDREQVMAVVGQTRPEAVIHCAAWTAVDLAEDPENREKVFAINAEGTRNVAEAAKAVGAVIMYISTDYIFDGRGTEPWKPEDRAFHPLNVYGESKLAGEKAVEELSDRYFIVRIAWVFGVNGNNFVKTMMRIGASYDTIRVVNDQIGTPTYTEDLSVLLADMIVTDRYGIYHATNEGGYISWYDFACEIINAAGCSAKVVPVTSKEYGLSKAARPFNSRMDKSKLDRMGFARLPHWKDALARYLREIEKA